MNEKFNKQLPFAALGSVGAAGASAGAVSMLTLSPSFFTIFESPDENRDALAFETF